MDIVLVAGAITGGYNLLKLIVGKTQNEESSEEEYDRWNEEADIFEARVRKRGDFRHVTRIEGYVNITIRDYSERQFREHFRMTRETYEIFEQILAPDLIRTAESGRHTLDVRTQLLAVLWLLATPDSFRVVDALNNVADRYIKWPIGERLDVVKHRFSRIGSLPDVIGAIGGCHIPILAPKVHPISYRTRKKEYAITLQAVCDADLIFTDCFVGFAGSAHDARIFRNSDLWRIVRRNENDFFPNNEFIIADKAYPVLPWYIAHINRGNMTEAQNNFNQHLSKMRAVIERAFALLKGRFRRLKYLHMSCADLIPYVILACCVLHNICLQGCKHDIDEFIEEGMDQAAGGNNNANDLNPNWLPNDPIGLARREYLTTLVEHIV
ncbi:protein ANTAGONIST OF LIKE HETEROCHROMATIN PROTEIN 1-like isoform X2 [Harpegnathos saltator]|uniref:protein ANTAGONIST OF LIKE HETEROCHROMATIN PROTEIN 1-like isoform X2 n=1 Tax=Harpegnathos saltator TaxID=610380 RepID=UPI000DBEE9A2|nr:protein ANTAGONIST OF LIKE HETEROCHROMATIN PROTEIN 1-like isoform X2 [Harpegnathos saltator]